MSWYKLYISSEHLRSSETNSNDFINKHQIKKLKLLVSILYLSMWFANFLKFLLYVFPLKEINLTLFFKIIIYVMIYNCIFNNFAIYLIDNDDEQMEYDDIGSNFSEFFSLFAMEDDNILEHFVEFLNLIEECYGNIVTLYISI